jgi:hypothetical protein
MSVESFVASSVGKAAVVGMIAFITFVGGCVARGKYDAGQLTEARTQRDQWKTTAENRGSAIGEINAQAAADAAEAKNRMKAAEDAADALSDAARDAEKRAEDFEAELDLQKRRRPSCAALLAGNLFETCGVKPR